MTDKDRAKIQRYADFLGIQLRWDGDWMGTSIYIGTDEGGPALNCGGTDLFPGEEEELNQLPKREVMEVHDLLHEIHHFLVAKLLNPAQLCFPDYGMGVSGFSTANHGYHLMEPKAKGYFIRNFYGALFQHESDQQEFLCWWLDCFIGFLLGLSCHFMNCTSDEGTPFCLNCCHSWAAYYDMKERDFSRSGVPGLFEYRTLSHYLRGAHLIIYWSLVPFLEKEIKDWCGDHWDHLRPFWDEVDKVQKNGEKVGGKANG